MTLKNIFGEPLTRDLDLPAEVSGNGFGNDVCNQQPTNLLLNKLRNNAKSLSQSVFANPEYLAKIHPCLKNSREEKCVKDGILSLLTKLFRRPVSPKELSDFVEFYKQLKSLSSEFKSPFQGFMEAAFQSPNFLFHVEFGHEKEINNKKIPSSYEMANRLSYLYWGLPPDAELLQAAASGKLLTIDSIQAQAQRLLNDPKAFDKLKHFFNLYLPILGLTDLSRDKAIFPNFSSQIGYFMQEEIYHLLRNQIFEKNATWPEILLSDYTFVNKPLADFYKMQTQAKNDSFVQVPMSTNRLGILTTSGVLTGTIHSDQTNPVTRGAFLVKEILCQKIPFPTGEIADKVKPPNPESAPTARERFTQHSKDPQCKGCHLLMDPIGFTLENFDPVGSWRSQENGVDIDTLVTLPNQIKIENAKAMVEHLAKQPETKACFASKLADFFYGRQLKVDDPSTIDNLSKLFTENNDSIKQFLMHLSTTDSFIYMSDH